MAQFLMKSTTMRWNGLQLGRMGRAKAKPIMAVEVDGFRGAQPILRGLISARGAPAELINALGNADLFVTPVKAGVQVVDFTGFRPSPE